MRLEEYLFQLHKDLVLKTYIHDPYESFYVTDPKRRHIHKASVRDRVMHQALFQVLYPIFDRHFIYDSYSSREWKGTHKGFTRLFQSCRKETKNWRVTAYTLKCDVRKFFDSINHDILRSLIINKVSDESVLWLIELIFGSFEKTRGKGLPLGNVTSQLFANVYMNELDQFVKHSIKAKHYFRYCDDFVIVHQDRKFLEQSLEQIQVFLKEKLKLELHPNKIEIRKVSQGIDFLGYVALPRVVVLRAKTGRRIIRKLNEKNIPSYLGVLCHCRARKLRVFIKHFTP